MSTHRSQTGIQTKDSATATAILGFIRQLFCSISVIIGGVVFQNGMQSQNKLLQNQIESVIASNFTGKEAAANVMLIKSLGGVSKVALRNAFSASLEQMWILFACTAAAGLVCSIFIQRRSLSRVHETVKVGLPENKEDMMLEDRGKNTVSMV